MSEKKSALLNKIETLKATANRRGGQVNSALTTVNAARNNVRGFMFDLIVALVGTQALNLTLGKIFTQAVGASNANLKQSLFLQSQTGTGTKPLPSFIGNGYSVPVRQLDVQNKFRYEPTSFVGQNLYSSNTNNIDYKIRESIVTGNEVPYKSQLNVSFDGTNEQVMFKPINPNQTDTAFLNTYISNIDGYDKKKLSGDILNKLLGNISNNQELSQNELYNQMVEAELLNQIIDTDLNRIDDFEFETFDMNELIRTNQIDLGCGVIINEVSNELFIEAVNNISSADNFDNIANGFESVFNSTLDPQTQSGNNPNTKSNLFKRIIDGFLLSYVENTLKSPESLLALNLIKSNKAGEKLPFESGEGIIRNNVKQIKEISSSIECIVNRELYGIIEKEITKLSKGIAGNLVREKLQVFSSIITNITA